MADPRSGVVHRTAKPLESNEIEGSVIYMQVRSQLGSRGAPNYHVRPPRPPTDLNHRTMDAIFFRPRLR